MEESFELAVLYNDRELMFPARLLHYGYTYRIEVNVDDATIIFDRDEEKNWRARVEDNSSKTPERALIESVLQSVESIF
jgi:hypothetical protein